MLKKDRKISFCLFFVFLLAFGFSQASISTSAKSTTFASNKIVHQIHHMSLKEKIGQMFVPDDPGSYNVRHYHLGGVIMPSSSFIGYRTAFKNNIKNMQRASHNSLLVGTDQEGGEVSRLNVDYYIGYHSQYPSPQQAYRRAGMRGIRDTYRDSAKNLHSLGINWNYAPDADVASRGSFIYPRTFGRGYLQTANYIKNAVLAIQHQHVAATLKHFPGYGSVSDTHIGSGYTGRSLYDFKHYDFIPFRAGVKAGVDSIMVTHIIPYKFSEYHRTPASESRKVIHLIRRNLHFHGVIVSDSLQMQGAINFARWYGATPDYLAVRAGNDMILSDDFKGGIPLLCHDIRKGWIPVKQINASVYRILMMKYKLGLNY